MSFVTTIFQLSCLLALLEGCLSQSGSPGSCVGRCDDPFDSGFSCQCNTACTSHGDCCTDYWTECGGQANSCQDKCSAGYDPSLPCQCNSECPQHSNCCPDYDDQCGGGSSDHLTDADLQELSELLLTVDTNNVGSLIELEWGCTTNNGNPEDCSPNPLFSSVDPSVETLPVFAALAALFDNYEPSPSQVEDHNQQEQEEEQHFLEEIMKTDVMRTTLQFLVDRGVFTGTQQDWKDYLYKIWFKLYDRARTTLGSSGFEHVFVGECCKGGDVGGFHGWYHYYLLEKLGHINYLGYWDQTSFGDNMMSGGGISLTFTWNGTQKPYGSFFLGTSPELEMALYTVCFISRPDSKCHVRLGGADVYIQTWTYSTAGDILVGSAYPDWAL